MIMATLMCMQVCVLHGVLTTSEIFSGFLFASSVLLLIALLHRNTYRRILVQELYSDQRRLYLLVCIQDRSMHAYGRHRSCRGIAQSICQYPTWPLSSCQA